MTAPTMTPPPVSSLPWMNVAMLSDGRTLQFNGRIVKNTYGMWPASDLSEADALSMIATRQLTLIPEHATDGRTRRALWHCPQGHAVAGGSQTEAWINSWRERGLIHLDSRQSGELWGSGWVAYRKLVRRPLTPLEAFHERWTQSRNRAGEYADYLAAAADADFHVGALGFRVGTVADEWLTHAERCLTALSTSGILRAIHLDDDQDGATDQ